MGSGRQTVVCAIASNPQIFRGVGGGPYATGNKPGVQSPSWIIESVWGSSVRTEGAAMPTHRSHCRGGVRARSHPHGLPRSLLSGDCVSWVPSAPSWLLQINLTFTWEIIGVMMLFTLFFWSFNFCQLPSSELNFDASEPSTWLDCPLVDAHCSVLLV